MTGQNDLILQTDRLILRFLQESDFAEVHSYGSCAENVKFMVWGPNSEKETTEFLQKVVAKRKNTPLKDYDFAIVYKESGKVIGSGGLYLNEGLNIGDIGWILHRDYWKKGICAEFAKELIRFGFEKLDLHRIWATCNAKNYGSYRVMEKAGMRREAHFLKSRFGRVGNENIWYDEFVYAILKEEYKANKK